MNEEILNYIYKEIGKSKIVELKGDASSRKYFRIIKNNNSYIVSDSSMENKQFSNTLLVNQILKKAQLSIPEIYHYDKQRKFMILEDFGNSSFNKLILKNNYKDYLLKIAIDNLIIINKLSINKKNKLKKLSFFKFEEEVSEFIDWYYPFAHKKTISNFYRKIFLDIWKKTFKKIKFNQNSFVHRDYFCNNLIYLKNRKKHLKCGIIDYQDGFIGDQVLDLVSLLEDSRRIIKTNHKMRLIKYYLKNTFDKEDYDNYLIKLNFIGASRQTRILGRWIKLYKIYNKRHYLKYIDYTWFWLQKNLDDPFLKDLKSLYLELLPLKLRKK